MFIIRGAELFFEFKLIMTGLILKLTLHKVSAKGGHTKEYCNNGQFFYIISQTPLQSILETYFHPLIKNPAKQTWKVLPTFQGGQTVLWYKIFEKWERENWYKTFSHFLFRGNAEEICRGAFPNFSNRPPMQCVFYVGHYVKTGTEKKAFHGWTGRRSIK